MRSASVGREAVEDVLLPGNVASVTAWGSGGRDLARAFPGEPMHACLTGNIHTGIDAVL